MHDLEDNIMESIVRITKISIKNFKNVSKGEITLANKRKNFKASILGLYGQNGSGKTALIDALELLKDILCGFEISDKFADYINVDSDTAEIQYTFDVMRDGTVYPVEYSLSLMRDIVQDDRNTDSLIEKNAHYKVKLTNEVLWCQTKTPSGKLRMGRLIDTSSTAVFTPKSKYNLLVSGDKAIATDLLVSKKLAQKTARSFVFSKDLLNAIRNNSNQNKLHDDDAKELRHYLFLIESLVKFGNIELFLLKTVGKFL